MRRPTFGPAALAALCMALAGPLDIGDAADRTVTPVADATTGMSDAERRHADQLVSLFENDTLAPQYAYIERLDDGRGYTAGRAGFTSGTGDLLLVVQRYAAQVPETPLATFLPALRALRTAAEKDDTSDLGALPAAWAAAASDARFRAAQDAVVDELYYHPAMAEAERLGIATALGKAMLYDAIIQHGGGDDPDSLSALIARTQRHLGGTPREGLDEVSWLREFLNVRRNDLSHPDDDATREEWARSVGRVDAFRRLLKTDNLGLRDPVRVVIDGRTIELP